MCHKAKDTSFYLPVDASDWIMLSNQISDIVIISLLYSYCEGIFVSVPLIVFFFR